MFAADRFLRFLRIVAPPALLAAASAGQDTRLDHVLARDFVADGLVLELQVPQAWAGRVIPLGWAGPGGTLHGRNVLVRAGRGLYDLRSEPGWSGPIELLATNARGIRAALRAPDFADELAIFMTPERMAPSSAGYAAGHSLFGWSWHAVLTMLGLATAGLVWLRCRRLAPALAVGFVTAWAAMAARGVVDHYQNIEAHAADLRRTPVLFEHLDEFADRCRDEIGDDTWTALRLPVTGLVYLRYQLAEHRYVRPRESPRYLITRKPQPHEQVFAAGGYRLYRRAD